MKSVFFSIVLLATSASFACEESCADLITKLAANYTCTIPGFISETDAIEASIEKKDGHEFEIEMGGETAKFVADGAPHKSNYDDSEYTVKCADSAVSITQVFKGQTAHVEVKKTDKGMDYTGIEKGMTISCTKK